ncbi:DUF4292 domain-containing protein [Cryomorphaceae bacterium 1068]|nr:DUF4292 domain-containing protein [Cryomorphaceae bacterium 1068]
MRRIIHLIFFFGLSLLILEGCKTKRALTKSPLVPLNEKAIIEQLQSNVFDFNTLSAKLSVNAVTEKENRSFKVNMRIASDSAIWMSITPALGIEAARAMITADSLKFIDKLADKYYLGDYRALDSLFGYEAQYEFLENLLVGNPIQILEGEKYQSVVDELYYVIQTKNPRKVRKAVDLSFKPSKEDTLKIETEIVKRKKLNKAVDKLEEEDLVIKRFYVRSDNFRVEKVLIEDLLTQRSFRVEYGNFLEVEGNYFAHDVDIFIDTPKESGKFEFSYSRIKINEPQSYPFKVPSKYEPLFR